MATQEQNGSISTSLEDATKFIAAFSDIPSYQRLFYADRQNVIFPRSRTTTPPNYPKGLYSVDAVVKVGFIVAENGSVEAARVLHASDSRFNEAAIESVKQWTFYSGYRNGKVDKFAMIIDVSFGGRR